MVAWVGELVCCAQPGAPRSGERTMRFLLSGPQLDTARAAEVVQEGRRWCRRGRRQACTSWCSPAHALQALPALLNLSQARHGLHKAWNRETGCWRELVEE